MATEKPRFSLTIADDLLERIEQFQVENRISTRNLAIRALVEKGMAAAAERDQPARRQGADEPSGREMALIKLVRALPAGEQGLALDLCSAVVRELLRRHGVVEEW